jgi:hypothetical protein
MHARDCGKGLPGISKVTIDVIEARLVRMIEGKERNASKDSAAFK